MSRTPEPPAEWTDEQTDDFFCFLGRYLFFFQWTEGLLDQILQLAWGFENWERSHARLANLSNRNKIRKVRNIVLSSPDFKSIQTWKAWCDHFDETMSALDELREQRNRITHAQYLFDFTKIGLPPMRSYRGRRDGEVKFDQELLGKETQEQIERNLMKLSVDTNFILGQLRHAYRSPADFGEQGNESEWSPLSERLLRDPSKINQ